MPDGPRPRASHRAAARLAPMGFGRYRGVRVTAKRRLVPIAEVQQHIECLRKLGVQIGAVDIRADGVTVYPPANSNPGNSLGDYINRNPLGKKTARER